VVEDVPVTIATRYVLIASMDVTPEAESLFNEIYDTEHVPNLLQVPGVRSVTRMKGEPARFAIGGSMRELPAPSPVYTAIYEIDDPQVLESPQWAEAVERGRWPSEVRPHTSNRQHLLFKISEPRRQHDRQQQGRRRAAYGSPPLLTVDGHWLTDP
jgi:hypothetical protein